MIGTRADHAHLHAVFRIPARETIEAVKALARVQIIDGSLPVNGEGSRITGNVYGSPPDIVLGIGMLDYPFVLWRPARLGSRVGYQRPIFGDTGLFLESDRMLV